MTAAFIGHSSPEKQEFLFDYKICSDISSFLQTNELQRLQLFPEDDAPAFDPFAKYGEPQDVTYRPITRLAGRRAYQISVYTVPHAELRGKGIVFCDGEPFIQLDCYPAYCKSEFHLKNTDITNKNHVHIKGAAATPISPNFTYGHLLIETLPRIYLLSILEKQGFKFPVVIPRGAPKFLKSIVDAFLPKSRKIEYSDTNEYITAEPFIIPSMMHYSYVYHSAMNNCYRECLSRHGVKNTMDRRIYLSRDKLKHRSTKRKFRNSDEIEGLFSSFGFDIIYPEQLDFEEQLALYASSAVIAGPHGSALHNSLFAPSGATVISIGHRNDVQTRVSSLRHQNLIALPVDGTVDDFAADPEMVREALRKLD